MTRNLVRKTCDILIALREGPMPRRELSERVRLPRSSLHWMLDDMHDLGFVERGVSKRACGMGAPAFEYWLADARQPCAAPGAVTGGDEAIAENHVLRRAIERACSGYPDDATAPTCVAILREALGHNVEVERPVARLDEIWGKVTTKG